MAARGLELWGGVECTLNRVGDTYFDQLAMSGHDGRRDDLQRFAGLGLVKLRFPALWERAAPDDPGAIDWTWTDERLNLARELGLGVIVGFVHHGSGPRYTSLMDPDFPAKLASFAARFAARYPWVEAYTPVNEPLTTARFSGLYGHWYPHGRDSRTFLRLLRLECLAIAAAMRAVRSVNPAAKLVQTEDLGKTFATPLLAYQADFENERRWLSFDLLAGHVGREHELWDYLRKTALSERELEELRMEACPPDMIGINHYVTSNRFLDERLERYPAHLHGGNGRHRYADLEAVRVCGEALAAGHGALLRETWERYRTPMAVTEVHIGCTREEQLRWFDEAWRSARSLRAEGIDVRAVTAWSLLGSFDWDSLVTRAAGLYESGVFDLRGPEPRPTALSAMLRRCAQGESFDHPVLDVAGWWRRSDRLLYAPVDLALAPAVESSNAPPSRGGGPPRSILLVGASGKLAMAFAFACQRRGLAYRSLTRQELDIASADDVARTLQELEPWAVINAAGSSRIDEAEQCVDACMRDHALGPAILAEACAARGTRLLSFSSDLVFDGRRRKAYLESSPVHPINVYGRAKVEGEARVFACCDDVLIVRTGALFGPWDEANFLTRVLRRLARKMTVMAACDVVVSPTYLPDLVHASLDLLIDGERGVWHLANDGAVSWAEFARLAAIRLGLDTSWLVALPAIELEWRAKRPAFSVLGSERGQFLSTLDSAIARYERECRVVVG